MMMNFEDMNKDELLKVIRKEDLKKSKLGIIHYKKQRKANKTHFCERCGCEIPKGDLVWWYKPYPIKNKRTGKIAWFKWRTRCIDHEPMRYTPDTFGEEVSEESYEDNGYGRY